MPQDDVAVFPTETGLPEPTIPRQRGPFIKSLHISLAAGSLGLLFATFLPLLHPYWPLADIAEHFALQILMAAVLLGALALALRRWRWLSVIAGIAFIQIWIIHPYWPVPSKAMALPSDSQTQLNLISLNVQYYNDSYATVLDYLSNSDADVIGLVEVSPAWKQELAALNAQYPFRIDCVSADNICQEMLLSKYPFQAEGKGRIQGKLPVLVWGKITPPGNVPPVTIAVTHLSWPFSKIRADSDDVSLSDRQLLSTGLPWLLQTKQAIALTDAVNQLEPDLILMGDFNMAPWSRTQQFLRRTTGLDSKGDLAPSWPNWLPAALRLPIDHVMTRGNPRLISLAAGPDVGPDHRPVEAVVAFDAP